METIYRKVQCSDRLPEEKGLYLTEFDDIYFDGEDWDSYVFTPEYWFEPVKLPIEEEIEEAAKNNADAIDRRGCSYWNGLFEGYQIGQRDLLSKLK